MPLRRIPLSPTPSPSGQPPGSLDPLAALLPRAAAGDERSVAVVFEAIAPALLSVVRALLGPTDPQVEDVAQEALLEVHEALPRFRGDSSFLHYARRITVRTTLAARRRRRRTEGILRAIADQASAPITREQPAAATEEQMLRERRVAAFRALLDELPEAQAESLALRVVLGQSLGQVAEATGVPVNTVRSRIRLAKEHLRARISGTPALAALFDVLEGEGQG